MRRTDLRQIAASRRAEADSFDVTEAETMLLSWVRGLREAKIVARHVQALLDRCTQRIEGDIITPAAELPRAEARGYLRAKAMHRLVVALGTKNDATMTSIPARLHETVLASAVERLTAVLWRHRELRKAAIVVRRAA